ncbi:CocE/NonD family hydrolase [Sphingomonas crusticola]|uniref:CocE/NonD family hydrolase n=1 Tax=Sphingomonas crusticola TaxID=1697973 RepID=UPI000E286F94|nr:CocE/NonD family hydrolase [Sphingomonas crusticola]
MGSRQWSRRQLLATGAAVGGCVGLALPASGATERNDVVLQSNVMVAMRDGILLATDIYRPAQGDAPLPGRFPVVLMRTPYDKTADKDGRFFAARGYVVVYQDCRGTSRSQGRLVKYLDDGKDGFDTCSWIVAQPWCNGKIGTMGSSYMAHTQGAMASAGAPGLAAMVFDCGGFSNAYQDGIRQGGAFELKQVTWALSAMVDSPELAKDPARRAAAKAIDAKAWFESMPWKRGQSPMSLVPSIEDFVYAQWEHGRFDDYWKQIGIYAAGYYDRFPDIPTLHISSWYDPYPRAATENYMALSRAKKGPTRLILGPWTHTAKTVSHSGDVEFGPNALFEGAAGEDYLTLRLQWFDHYLRGLAAPVASEPAVRVFVMGGGSGRRDSQGRLDHGGRWRSEKDWPLPTARLTPMYLHPRGGLSDQPPSDPVDPVSYDFDPANPVPTVGGTVTNNQLMLAGAYDQREDARFFGSKPPYLPLAARPDVLVFQTDWLDQDVEVTGAIDAKLWISSSAPDTDFTIKLIDVYPPNDDYPDGFAMNVTDGIMRVRYRDSWEKPKLLKAGEVVPITVSAFPTSNLFKRGHRIRLDISSSNFPHFDVNPNTGAPEGVGLTRQVARNSIYMDAKRPSHVLLPLIPART